MARIYISKQQLLTSSTLDWRPPDDATHPKVNVGQSTVPWCKMRQNGLWVTGGVFEGQCTAPLLQKTVKSLATQVLYSLNGFARLEYAYWDRQERFPDNPVSSGNVLLAYKEDSNDGFLPGYVDPIRRRGYFLKGDQIIKNDSAILLVEKEPMEYQLSKIVYTKDPKISVTEEMINKFELVNPSESEKVVTEQILFTAPHTTYYGRVPGTLTGLTTEVPSPHGGVMNIIWNRINVKNKDRTYEIRRLLPPRSFVVVVLKMVVRSLDVQYAGQLTALFSDGVTITRNISAPHSEIRMSVLKGDFSGPFSIDHGGVLSRQPHVIEVLLHSSTTTTTPSSLFGNEHSFEESKYQGATDAALNYSAKTMTVFVAVMISFLLM